MSKPKKAAVLGAGSWGTALANHLNRTGTEVTLWGRDRQILQAIASEGINKRYFPSDKLSSGISTTDKLPEALEGADLAVFSVPSAAMRQVAKLSAPHLAKESLIVSTAKGLESGSLATMVDVLGEELANPARITVLGGPSFALEVVRGQPTAVVIAGQSEETAKAAAEYFHHDYFRVYTSRDVIGVELGGAVKNVIALAAGVVDGVGLGNNARAALITRGIAELNRLVEAAGGDRQTAAGLSGLGDLLLTATGDLSRNRRVGLLLGEGKSLTEILAQLGQTAEAVTSARMLRQYAEKLNVAVPILEQVDLLLAEKISVEQALQKLFSRKQKSEQQQQ